MAQALLVGDVFRNSARSVPDRVAAVHGDRSITFGELDRASNRVARALGVARGERVCVWSDTNLDLVIVFAALAKAGAVFAPVNALLTPADAASIAELAQPAVVLVDDAHDVDLGMPRRTLRDLLGTDESDEPFHADVQETDPHVVFFTSGTTGRPKGVVLSNRVSVLRSHPGSQLEPRGAMVCPYPLFHMGAFTIAMQQWHARDTVVFTASDAASICDAVERYSATRLNCIPGVWQRVLDHLDGRTLPTLRFADTGTSTTPPELLRTIAAAAPNAFVRVFYGSTESGNVAQLDHDDVERKPGSCGVPAPLVETRIDDSGELLVRTAVAFDGYFGDPAATADAVVDGWYRTGDLAEADADGYLSIVGRARELIRTGGESVVPGDVEAALVDHPAVADIAVIGIPDPQWGEIVCAVVVAAGDPPTLDDLVAHCETRLARFQRPRRLALVDAIPRNATDKIQRRLLVEQLS